MKTQFRKNLLSGLITAALGAVVIPGSAFAAEADILKKIDALQAEINALKAEAAASRAAATATAPAAQPAATAAVTRFDNGYLSWASADGNFELKVDGRVQLDFGAFDSQLNHDLMKSDTKFRRVRLGLKSKLWKDWEGEFDIDFASNQVDIKDMWLAYKGIPGVGIKLGHFKPHFSIDQVTSSRVATFMEGSIATELLAPSRRIGVAADFANDRFFVGGGFFGDKINTGEEARDNPSLNGESETHGYALRAAIRPLWVGQEDKAFHIGLNVMNNRPRSNIKPDDARLKFAGVVETELSQVEMIDTKQIQGVDGAFITGLEAAFKYGPHVLVAEYLKTKVKLGGLRPDMHASVAAQWPTIAEPEFETYYAAYSYFISGQRKYDPESAEFAGVIGRNALELTARYSVADMNDSGGYTGKRTSAYKASSRGVFGGKAKIATIGLNWYPNPNMKFLVNYMLVDLDKDADADAGSFERPNATVVPVVGGDRIKVLGVRAQFTF